MKIKQFQNEHLSHYSYALWTEGEMAIIDPMRDIEIYKDFASENDCSIVAIIQTHTHADFVSGHLQLAEETGTTIYCSSEYNAHFEHKAVADGENIPLGNDHLFIRYTPGHSMDSITVIAESAGAVFSGDTLFIGDCGRPDLRETDGVAENKAEKLARAMYQSLRSVYLKLPDEMLLYPCHGAGSLCGKNMSDANSSTMGNEKMSNWSLQKMDEDEFVDKLLTDQPFIPRYFSQCVEINRRGAEAAVKVADQLNTYRSPDQLNPDMLFIDLRSAEEYRNGHLAGALNLQLGKKLETWLGSVVNPGEKFYLCHSSEEVLWKVFSRMADIGYEEQVAGLLIYDGGKRTACKISAEKLRSQTDAYTIVDIRNPGEVKENEVFKSSIKIPLYQLRERISEIPTDKPVVVHCAAGYRSAAGSSILEKKLDQTPIYDLGDDIKEFM